MEKLKQIYRFFRHIYYTIKRKLTHPKYENIKVMSDEQTIKYILKGYSIARYGDGEFQWMLGIKNNSFQDNNNELQKKLIETYNSKQDKFLICISNAFCCLDDYSHDDQMFWQTFINKNYDRIEEYIDYKKVYGNTNVSRPYIQYNSKEREKSAGRFKNLKKIWNNKKVLIIEGNKTRLGVGNDLLNNTKEVKRLLCPATNAFDCYEDILKFIDNMNYNPDITILALGPTATILSLDLCKRGMQAVDIGHIDVEYEWFLKKAKRRIPIDGKYVNECIDKKSINKTVNDIKYNESIIGELKND